MDLLEQVRQKQDEAKSLRKKGEALRKAGHEEAARQAFNAGVARLDDALTVLEPEAAQIAAAGPPLSGELGGMLRELIETFGARAGMLQRLGLLKEASQSYSQGASLEQKFDLPGTYNRLNAVRYLLLAGATPLAELEPRIRKLAEHIEESLRSDKSMNDNGWVWADLGDCMALLGKVHEAQMAYATFISKAEIKSPERTLDVLKQIASKLAAMRDPDAVRLQRAVSALQTELTK